MYWLEVYTLDWLLVFAGAHFEWILKSVGARTHYAILLGSRFAKVLALGIQTAEYDVLWY